ncbi:hypothetical protein ACETRX_03775 [Labrys portucalensis]|uniref:DUF2793 domain-containing protein n=1 Tax=Labrys neptuniae TaxID=376174 RepID=A0ABV6Z970_9HYPH
MAPFVPGQILTAAQLNSALDAKFDAGGVSSFSATVLAKPTAVQWKAAIGLVGGPLTTAVGHFAFWDSTDGTVLKDGGEASTDNILDRSSLGAGTLTVTQSLTAFYNILLTLGTAAQKNVGTASGNVPVLDGSGKLATSTIPTVPVAQGGTGQTSLTANRILLGNGTSAVAFVSAVGNSGQILIGQGAAPTWNTVSGDGTLSAAGAITVTKTNGTTFGTAATKNTGTAAGQIPLLDGSARLPAVDGSLLTGITSTWAPGTLIGLTLSRASATTVGIATGFARNEDSGTAFNMTLASAITKSLSTWAAGTGNGGLDTGSIAASTWYHVHLIRKDSDGSIDALLSLSATAPTTPSGYTARRRLGAILTDGSSQIVSFTQNGDRFRWTNSRADISATVSDAVAHLLTLSTPTGVRTDVDFQIVAQNTGTFTYVYFSATDQADEAPSIPNGPAAPGFTAAGGSTSNAGLGSNRVTMTADTSGQVRYRFNSASAATTLYVFTYGWTDTRGRL